MVLSAAQMAVMSRVLDEALPLDEAGRRRWLQQLIGASLLCRPSTRSASNCSSALRF